MIGISNNEENLIQYSKKIIINLFIRKKLKFFGNEIGVIDYFIVFSRDLFNSVMIENNIPMTEISPMQFSILLIDYDETFKIFIEGVKNDTI